MASTKSFAIPKRAVFEGWKRVKANRGGAGIDQESLAAFEKNLAGNLYKIWNRMVSGSYFPPPVKQVGIPKKDGGVRYLGVPTVADRVAQTVVKMVLSRRILTLIPMAIALGNRPRMRWQQRGRGAGSMTGWLSLISKEPLTILTMI